MDNVTIQVLIIRKSLNAYSASMESLGKYGCECRIATSYQEVERLVGQHKIDVALAPLRLRNDSLFPLMGVLSKTQATLFYSVPVQDGCWWLPALWRGLDCLGRPAFRSSQFIAVFHRTIECLRGASSVPIRSPNIAAPGFAPGPVAVAMDCSQNSGSRQPDQVF